MAWHFGWKHCAGLVAVSWTLDASWEHITVHLFPQRKHWSWGYQFSGYYDGAPIWEFGGGPLFLIAGFGWELVAAPPNNC